MKKCLVVIEEDLIMPAIDELSYIKIDLEKKWLESSVWKKTHTTHDEYQ